MKAKVPHFDLPFKWVADEASGFRASVEEQDTLEDIGNCVEAILRYEVGYRIELPQFGTPEQVFKIPSADKEEIYNAVETWEVRVSATVGVEKDRLDAFIDHVRVEISTQEPGAEFASVHRHTH